MSVIVLGPNPLLWIGHRTIIMGIIGSRPHQLLLRPRINLKMGLPTQSERSALPVKPFHTCQSCIYRRLAPHSNTQLTCSFSYEARCNYQLERGEEEWRISWFELSLEHCIMLSPFCG
jgi:hypothetical protein